MTAPIPTLAVVVGRFQVPDLHAGHRHLLDTALCAHGQLLIVIGSGDFPTPRNPLSYEMRRAMVQEAYPEAVIREVRDHPSDQVWSASLDILINETFPDHEAVLYSSRDSFLRHYSGSCRTVVVEELPGFSGTVLRTRLAHAVQHSAAFRAGVIHNFVSRLAVTRPMVDIAVLRGEHVLLGGKDSDPPERWRFIGGLIDQTDATFEDAALRELHEEALCLSTGRPRYIGSKAIEDWRYRGSGECGITAFFSADYHSGTPEAGDDLDRLAWKKLSELPTCLVPEHVALGEMLIASLAENHRIETV